MIKKALKITMVLFMILGIVFSIFNFVSCKFERIENTSEDIINTSKPGAWIYLPDGTRECMGDGDECVISGGYYSDQ